MKEFFNQLLPPAVRNGVMPAAFWHMTAAEIFAVLDAAKEQAEEDRHARYEQAALISACVGAAFGGKPIPTYAALFEGKAEQDWRIMKEQLIDFAEGRRRMKNGTDNVRT